MDEVLLELVEEQIRLAVSLRCGRDRVDEARRRPELGIGGVHRRNKPGLGLDRPLAVHDHRTAAERAKPLRDPCPQQRALADAARPEEDGQPVREDVRDDRLPLALAAEEEERVERGVAERQRDL